MNYTLLIPVASTFRSFTPETLLQAPSASMTLPPSIRSPGSKTRQHEILWQPEPQKFRQYLALR
jgi:hypothetical protein